jgi:hypothetical protein
MALFGEMKVIVDIYYSSYSAIDLAGISNGEVLMKAATKSAGNPNSASCTLLRLPENERT